VGVAHFTVQIAEYSDFAPFLSASVLKDEAMHPRLQEKLREAGDKLRASHDDAIIADVIGEVEELEDDSAAETAEILRFMVEEE
jgi:hypothetical protein